ncbi:hypothetical protein WGT02_25930 (plasmid) [Rhizobium sp. T1470]|uniref:hypothetical protein n=1 Tax=Rhizobium sp. T1473 TaxID=555321 RepID=UPI001AAE4B28|nr:MULTISPECIES: hypothetical protein [Rhizobium]MCA0805605.1 hypothetical protein [Rhizobium sp. T1473]MCS0459234.1 hypothetical protein [Rhizobium favelukesii]
MTATPTPSSKLVTPMDHTLIMIDFQSQMSFATKSIDAVNLHNNAALVAHGAKGFGVWNCSATGHAPTSMTTGIAKNYGGSYGLGIIYAKTTVGASKAH